jgi:hypothetical protein
MSLHRHKRGWSTACWFVVVAVEDLCEGFECEHTCWDPKDGELCLSRAKPEETLVEARSDTDVQIVRLT